MASVSGEATFYYLRPESQISPPPQAATPRSVSTKKNKPADIFPSEIWTVVFAYLSVWNSSSKICRTCRDFEAIWKDSVEFFELTHYRKCLDDIPQRKIIRNLKQYPRLSKINFWRKDSTLLVDDYTMGLCAQYLQHQLKHVNIMEHVSVTDVGLKTLAKGCPNIEELYIGGNATVTDLGIRDAVQLLPKLRVLDLIGCTGLTDEVCLHIARSPAAMSGRITRLDLSWISNITDKGIEYLYSSSLPGERVDKQSLPSPASPFDAEFSAVLAYHEQSDSIQTQLPQSLEVLDLSCCSQLNEVCILTLRKFHKLADLRLSGCPLIRFFVVSDLSRKFPAMKRLDLLGCDALVDADLNSMGAMRCLDSLNLMGTIKFSTSTLFDALSMMDRLTSLNLSRTELDDDRAEAVGRACGHSLKFLRLDGNPKLTDSGLERMGPYMRSLRHLTLIRCFGLGMRCGLALERFPQLRGVNMIEAGVDSDGIMTLAACMQGRSFHLVTSPDAKKMTEIKASFVRSIFPFLRLDLKAIDSYLKTVLA